MYISIKPNRTLNDKLVKELINFAAIVATLKLYFKRTIENKKVQHKQI